MKKQLLLLAATAAFGLTGSAAFADTLADVKARGFVQCGVTEVVPGFGQPDESNN